jgi:predicted enzyme related to lactoylglutathione lyase
MIEQIDYIAMVVRDLDRAMRVYLQGLGLDAERVEQSDEFQVRMAFIPVGDIYGSSGKCQGK